MKAPINAVRFSFCASEGKAESSRSGQCCR